MPTDPYSQLELSYSRNPVECSDDSPIEIYITYTAEDGTRGMSGIPQDIGVESDNCESIPLDLTKQGMVRPLSGTGRYRAPDRFDCEASIRLRVLLIVMSVTSELEMLNSALGGL